MAFTYKVADEAADFFRQEENKPAFQILQWIVEKLLSKTNMGQSRGLLAGFVPPGKPAMYALDFINEVKANHPQGFLRGGENGTYWVALFVSAEQADEALNQLRPQGTPFNHDEGTPFVAEVTRTRI